MRRKEYKNRNVGMEQNKISAAKERKVQARCRRWAPQRGGSSCRGRVRV